MPIHFYNDLIKKTFGYFPNKGFYYPPSYSYRYLPIFSVLIKTSPDLDEKKIKELINKFHSIYYFNVWTYHSEKINLDRIEGIINVIFNSVSLVVLIFCFFNLGASITINILEQTKEISILRALGITCNCVIMIYIFECFILIFSSSIIGLIIGTFISWTMILQRIIFTNLPLSFTFPTFHFIIIFIISTFGAILTTFFPARKIIKMQISEIYRFKF